MSSAPRSSLAAPIAVPFTPQRLMAFNLVACGMFVVLGVVTTLLGPILPFLAVRWSISTAQAGTLFSWQFACSTIGTLLSGALLARRSFKAAIVLGIALCLAGVGWMLFVDWNGA